MGQETADMQQPQQHQQSGYPPPTVPKMSAPVPPMMGGARPPGPPQMTQFPQGAQSQQNGYANGPAQGLQGYPSQMGGQTVPGGAPQVNGGLSQGVQDIQLNSGGQQENVNGYQQQPMPAAPGGMGKPPQPGFIPPAPSQQGPPRMGGGAPPVPPPQPTPQIQPPIATAPPQQQQTDSGSGDEMRSMQQGAQAQQFGAWTQPPASGMMMGGVHPPVPGPPKMASTPVSSGLAQQQPQPGMMMSSQPGVTAAGGFPPRPPMSMANGPPAMGMPPPSTSLPQQQHGQQQPFQQQPPGPPGMMGPPRMSMSSQAGMGPPSSSAFQQTHQMPPTSMPGPPTSMPGPPTSMPGPPGGMQHGQGQQAPMMGMQQMAGPPGMPGGPGMMHQHPGMPQQQQQQQQQRRLDPNMMPSAVQVMEDDRRARTGPFPTGWPTAEQPPLVTTDFYAEDTGNCRPGFMRPTIYSAPGNSDLLKHSALPFGVAICPLATKHIREYDIPVIDFGDIGPVRCHRCKAYMCPFMEFHDGGRRFRCPFCRSSTEVPSEYFAHLDHQGQRTDRCDRPELFLGSVEMIATKEYCKNGLTPKEPAFIFMLDVSYNSVRNGVVDLFCQNVKSMLASLPREVGAERSEMRVGFATYDQTVHFYNLKNSLDQPQMMIVGDVGDMFVPMVDGFLVHPEEAETAIDLLLEEIPRMFAESRVTEILLGPVVQAGMEALKAADRAGKLFVFHSSLPTLEAPGKLKNRDDRKLLASEKEKTVLTPQGDFYTKLAGECVGVGCSVDMYLFPNSFIDVATLGNLSGTTGGQLYKYPYFQVENDGARFLADLEHDISRPIVFDAIMRVRTSTGIRPTDFYGSMYMSNTTDVELASVDSDKAVTIEIRHDDKLEEQAAFVQAALLFTSVSGQRRLRIHNLSMVVAQDYQTLYRLADLDTTVNFLAKAAARMVLQKTPKEVKDYVVGRTAQILATYREKCSEQAPPGQLILPEGMKLLPLYANCIIKNDGLFGGSDLQCDDKAWLLQAIPSLRVKDSVWWFFPRLLPVSSLPPEAAESDNFELPSPIRPSYENLARQEAFVLENGICVFLWVGQESPSQWVQDVFGCQNVTQINLEKHELPEKDNQTSRSLRRLLRRLERDRPRKMKLYVIGQGSKLEPWMKKFLVEDRGSDSSPSYVDFLCHVHREIRNILS